MSESVFLGKEIKSAYSKLYVWFKIKHKYEVVVRFNELKNYDEMYCLLFPSNVDENESNCIFWSNTRKNLLISFELIMLKQHDELWDDSIMKSNLNHQKRFY